MKWKLRLDIWNTDFEVVISSYMIEKIKKIVCGEPFPIFKNKIVSRGIYYHVLNGKSTKVKNYLKLLRYLDINLKEGEKNIDFITYRGSKQKFPFIKEFSPLMFRIVCHLIGDGSFPTKSTGRWIQRRENSRWLVDLIKSFNIESKESSKGDENKCSYILIPNYFLRITDSVLGIESSSIKNPDTLKRLLSLPKEYKIQLISSLIVDEGHFRYKGVRSCILSQSNRRFMETIHDFLDDLDYDHSKIKEEIDKNGNRIYRINIYVQGTINLYKDVKESIRRYGIYSGLWHKQKQIEDYVNTCFKDPKYSKYEKELIVNLILTKIKQKGTLSYGEIRRDEDFISLLEKRSKRYLVSRFYNLVKQRKIERVSDGVYKSINLRDINLGDHPWSQN